MTAKPLTAGTIYGRKCPYCPTVAQRPPDRGTDFHGLAEHVEVVHPYEFELYEQWKRAT